MANKKLSSKERKLVKEYTKRLVSKKITESQSWENILDTLKEELNNTFETFQENAAASDMSISNDKYERTIYMIGSYLDKIYTIVDKLRS